MGLRDGQTYHLYGGEWSIAGPGRRVIDRGNDVHTTRNFAKNRVLRATS